jgi:2-isopropylmalate synthase
VPTHVVLCDTNGGSLPHEVAAIVADVYRHVGNDVVIGIHCHDDTGCAVANSMAAVLPGARHVQGTLNGLGERTGNCNLTTVIPNLQLKLGMPVPARRPPRAAHAVSNHVAEVLNRPLNPQAPYVGSSAFAHKAGLHVSAIKRARDAYEHVDPDARRQRHPLRRQRDGRPRHHPDQGRGSRACRWTGRRSTR